MAGLRQRTHNSDKIVMCFIVSLFLILLIAVLSVSPVHADPDTPTPTPAVSPATGATIPPELIILVGAIVLFALILPAVYVLLKRPKGPVRSLLFVSTDESSRKVVIDAAKRVGYITVHVYRYEDALDKLRQDSTLSMIIIDDSVPQYEAGLLLSMLQRLPIGIRPLILIHDSSELGQTAPSYRAEAVVARPLTVKTMEAAIRQVSDRIELAW